MKFVYLGCEGAPEVSTHFGVEFTIGQPAEVTDPAAIAKLSGHPHFTVAGAVDGQAAETKPKAGRGRRAQAEVVEQEGSAE